MAEKTKAAANNSGSISEQESLLAQSRLNRKYQRIITQESETVKHLFQMLSPEMANFQKAKREIEPYDDIEKLRETNIG